MKRNPIYETAQAQSQYQTSRKSHSPRPFSGVIVSCAAQQPYPATARAEPLNVRLDWEKIHGSPLDKARVDTRNAAAVALSKLGASKVARRGRRRRGRSPSGVRATGHDTKQSHANIRSRAKNTLLLR